MLCVWDPLYCLCAVAGSTEVLATWLLESFALVSRATSMVVFWLPLLSGEEVAGWILLGNRKFRLRMEQVPDPHYSQPQAKGSTDLGSGSQPTNMVPLGALTAQHSGSLSPALEAGSSKCCAAHSILTRLALYAGSAMQRQSVALIQPQSQHGATCSI